MTPPVRPEFDPARLDAAVKALKAQGAPDEAIHAYLQQTVGLKPVAQAHDYHAEFQSGALQKRMEGANARDVANAQENTESVGPLAAFGHSLGATMANAGEGIPGFEAAQAGLRKLIRREPYGEALSDIRRETGKLPGVLKTGERIVGAMPLTKFLPGSAAKSGAILGAMDGALSAEPDKTINERAGGAVLGGVAGMLTGGLGERVVTGGRVLLSKTPAANVIARQAARALSAKQLYGAAMQEGQGQTGTATVQKFLQEPDISEIVSELQQGRPHQGVAADAPEMLDAVYKTLSDRAAQLRKGLDAVTPNRPNIGRFRLQDTKAAQGDLLDAVSGSYSMPGPMPTYRTAVQDFADKSAGIEGVERGTSALKNAMSMKLTNPKQLTRTTPEALQEWSHAANDASKTAAGEGVLGGAKEAFQKQPLGMGRIALKKAPGVMRNAGVPSQAISDMLTKIGLISTNVATQP